MAKWQRLETYTGRSEYNHRRYLRYKHLNLAWCKKRNALKKIINAQRLTKICPQCGTFTYRYKNELKEHKENYHSY